jgi:hypothetical protein
MLTHVQGLVDTIDSSCTIPYFILIRGLKHLFWESRPSELIRKKVLGDVINNVLEAE